MSMGGKLFQKASSEKSSIILNENALIDDTTDFLPMRDKELAEITDAIRPLLSKKKGDNLFIHGPSGSGKMTVMKYVLGKLAKETARVLPVYVNCWEFPTQMAIYSKIIEALEIPIPRRGLATDEVFARILENLEKDGVSILLVLDNVQNLVLKGDEDIFHAITGVNASGKSCFSIIGMSAQKNALERLSAQARLAMNFTTLEFEEYNEKHLMEILEERAENALSADAWSEETLAACARIGKADGGNARLALEILRRAAKHAEGRGSRKINVKDVQVASSRSEYVKSLLDSPGMRQFGISDDGRLVLQILAERGAMASSDLYDKYRMQRDITKRHIRNHLDELANRGFIQTTLVDRPGMLKSKIIQIK